MSPGTAAFQVTDESLEKKEVEESRGVSKNKPNKTLVGHQHISKQACLVVPLIKGVTEERGMLLHLFRYMAWWLWHIKGLSASAVAADSSVHQTWSCSAQALRKAVAATPGKK